MGEVGYFNRALQRAQMNSKQLKMRNDQERLRFQCLIVQTENLQVDVQFLMLLLALLQFGPLFYLLKAKFMPSHKCLFLLSFF